MKLMTLLLLLVISTSLYAQQTAPGISTDYLKKSKNQKKIGLILLGGGATFVLTGVLISKGDPYHESIWGVDYKNDGIKSTFISTGILSLLGSIPLFIISSKNKKKAGSVSLRNETIRGLQKRGFAYKPVPSVCLTVRL